MQSSQGLAYAKMGGMMPAFLKKTVYIVPLSVAALVTAWLLLICVNLPVLVDATHEGRQLMESLMMQNLSNLLT